MSEEELYEALINLRREKYALEDELEEANHEIEQLKERIKTLEEDKADLEAHVDKNSYFGVSDRDFH
jgi:predicted nuclease with TOPRIM domain